MLMVLGVPCADVGQQVGPYSASSSLELGEWGGGSKNPMAPQLPLLALLWGNVAPLKPSARPPPPPGLSRLGC